MRDSVRKACLSSASRAVKEHTTGRFHPNEGVYLWVKERSKNRFSEHGRLGVDTAKSGKTGAARDGF
jgi:hypothetical protein